MHPLNSLETHESRKYENSEDSGRASKILGFWRLKEWIVVKFDQSTKPFSENKIDGFLLYSPHGKMSVSLFETKQQVFITTYGGNFKYIPTENMMIHFPTVGNSPEGINEPKKRFLSFNHECLVLETDWILGGDNHFKYRLVWEKIP